MESKAETSELVDALATQVLEEAVARYLADWENEQIFPGCDREWAAGVELYPSLDSGQRRLLTTVVRLVIKDSISEILGVMAGSTTLDAWIGRRLVCSVVAESGEELVGDLQTVWLDKVKDT